MRLESGPARTDTLWNAAILLACLGMAGWFVYDWKIGYPQSNLEEAQRRLAELLGDPARVPDPLPQQPTKDDFMRIVKQNIGSLEQVRALLGEPLLTRRAAGREVDYYVSAYGVGLVPHIGDRVLLEDVRWDKWKYTYAEIQQQYWCAIIALLFGVYFAWRTYKAATLRVVLDEQGIDYAGRRIAWEAVTRLDNYSPKCWVDIFYRDNGNERKIRLDNQKVARFDEIIDAICQRKGFEDPRAAAVRESAAEPHDASDRS